MFSWCSLFCLLNSSKYYRSEQSTDQNHKHKPIITYTTNQVKPTTIHALIHKFLPPTHTNPRIKKLTKPLNKRERERDSERVTERERGKREYPFEEIHTTWEREMATNLWRGKGYRSLDLGWNTRVSLCRFQWLPLNQFMCVVLGVFFCYLWFMGLVAVAGDILIFGSRGQPF